MPYIVCVNMPGCLPEQDPRAVATLEEARAAANDELYRGEGEAADALQWQPFYGAADALPESGGVIGPLPDGYVIDVQRLSWPDLAALVSPTLAAALCHPTSSVRPSHDDIINAYNAQLGSATHDDIIADIIDTHTEQES